MLKEKELRKKVKNLLFGNMYKGYSRELDYEYCYTKPARERYPFQYFWDTCFHTYMLLAVDEPDHAKLHIESLLRPQPEDGFIGNIIYWKQIMPARITDFFQMKIKSILQMKAPHMSGIIQPPMLAQAVRHIHDHTGDVDFVRKVLPGLKKYYGWLRKNRDLDGDNLLTIITTFESGMDWKPTFDPVVNYHKGKAGWELFLRVVSVDFRNFLNNYNMRRIREHDYFRVKEVGFNSIYAKNLNELSELCKLAGDEDGQEYAELSSKVIRSMISRMYDEEDAAFYDVYGKDDRKLKILTPTIFYPVMINRIPQEIGKVVMERHFYNSQEFKADYPLPSVAKNEPSFYPGESMYLWRGPTWIVNNWFMHKYLLNTEHHEKAKTLMSSMMDLIEKSGFREYYNPFTGQGYGAHDFTWAGLILDMFLDEKKQNLV